MICPHARHSHAFPSVSPSPVSAITDRERKSGSIRFFLRPKHHFPALKIVRRHFFAAARTCLHREYLPVLPAQPANLRRRPTAPVSRPHSIPVRPGDRAEYLSAFLFAARVSLAALPTEHFIILLSYQIKKNLAIQRQRILFRRKKARGRLHRYGRGMEHRHPVQISFLVLLKIRYSTR